jgi:hypothetical protein
MIGTSQRALAIVTACWAVPYVASKVDLALQGELGVHGGPRVVASDYAPYGSSAAVSAAQGANAAAGLLILALSLLPALPFARRISRWVIAVPLACVAASHLAVAGIMLSGAADRGGILFVIYLLIWAGLLISLAVAVVRRPRAAVAAAAA